MVIQSQILTSISMSQGIWILRVFFSTFSWSLTWKSLFPIHFSAGRITIGIHTHKSHISGEIRVMNSSWPPYPPHLPALFRRYVHSSLCTDAAADLPYGSPERAPRSCLYFTKTFQHPYVSSNLKSCHTPLWSVKPSFFFFNSLWDCGLIFPREVLIQSHCVLN